MTLDQLIEKLEKRDPSKVIKNGFGEGMSWRGRYDQAAFTPVEETTYGEMLKHAKELIGSVQEGYKGGAFEMRGSVNVHIAAYGEYGEPMTSMCFRYWDNLAESVTR